MQQHKLATLKELGVTRLSLGVENFDDAILEANGRAHLSAEIFRAYGWARDLSFPQINIDLIAGMVGETWDNWKSVRPQDHRAGARQRHDLPDGAAVQHGLFQGAAQSSAQHEADLGPVADWPTKRAWVDYAFDELVAAGYEVSSAYTVVKDRKRCRFVYRDSLWHGADMFGTGVASFGHVSGVHVQNVDSWEEYVGRLQQGRPASAPRPCPSGRASVDPRNDLAAQDGPARNPLLPARSSASTSATNSARVSTTGSRWLRDRANGRIELTREGLLEVDRRLPTFFLPEHLTTRYT